MSLMMPDSGVTDPDRLVFAALLLAPVPLPDVEYAVRFPFADWSGEGFLFVPADGSDVEALLSSGGVLVQRAGDDKAWTEVAR